MTAEKSHLKVMVANDIGSSMEDKLEGTLQASHEHNGAVAALRQASKQVPLSLCAKIDDMLNEGAIKEGMTQLNIAEMLKKQVIKAGHYLDHLADVAQQKAIQLTSQADGIKIAMTVVKKMVDTEQSRLQAIVDAADVMPDSTGNDARPTGVHPGMSTAAQRKAGEAAARGTNGTVAERRMAAKADKQKAAKKSTKKKAKKDSTRTKKVARKIARKIATKKD